MKRVIFNLLCAVGLIVSFCNEVFADYPDVASPLVAYQFFDTPNDSAATNATVFSPLTSYQYFDWPGDDVLQFQFSPLASYFYNIGAAGPNVALRGRVTDSSATPLAGATISASVLQVTQATTQTAVDGSYSLAALSPGVYALKASLANYATSARALTLSAATANQNFQLALLPAAPTLVQTTRQPPAAFTQPPVGPMGSTLKVFDGSQFVAITADNKPPPDRMTIVMTHGWKSDPEGWAQGMAATMRTQGVTPQIANIVAWDWQVAAVGVVVPYVPGHFLDVPPEERTPSQGVALGHALQVELGDTYARPIHFIGHSLGALVNAAAANYLHDDNAAQEEISPTPWTNAPMHMTLFDHAAAAGTLGGISVLFDGITASLYNGTSLATEFGDVRLGVKFPVPIRFTWADNYVSAVGLYQHDAVNIVLQKAPYIVGPNLDEIHNYPWMWYTNSIGQPTVSLLGFQRSYEAYLAGLSGFGFPPSSADFSPGVSYHQAPLASDALVLEPFALPGVVQAFGALPDVVVQGEVGLIQAAGDVAVHVWDGAQAAGQWIASGFNYVGNLAIHGQQSLVNLFDSAVLRLTLHTTPAPPPGPLALRAGPRPLDGGGTSNSQPMAWLPIQFPAAATAMAFDFTVEGDPVDDVLVCGIGETNLFSLEAKYIPTNTMSASRLIDVSAWAGTTNELFFGFMGGTSTNATLVIENIRFYSLQPPQLNIVSTDGTTLLTWPGSAGGYVVESTPSLASPVWETATNPPAISADSYILTNYWNDQTRFFRLRSQ